MIQVDEPPDITACAACPAPLTWLYSVKRGGWVAFVPLDEQTLKVHGCKELQEPGTWRDLRRGTPPTDEYKIAKAELKDRTEGES